MKQGWEVTCVECEELRWPYLAERPEQYVCVLCRSLSPERKAMLAKRGERIAATKRARRSVC